MSIDSIKIGELPNKHQELVKQAIATIEDTTTLLHLSLSPKLIILSDIENPLQASFPGPENLGGSIQINTSYLEEYSTHLKELNRPKSYHLTRFKKNIAHEMFHIYQMYSDRGALQRDSKLRRERTEKIEGFIPEVGWLLSDTEYEADNWAVNYVKDLRKRGLVPSDSLEGYNLAVADLNKWMDDFRKIRVQLSEHRPAST